MAYSAPYIDEQGWHSPSYNDLLQALINSAKSIFGEDIYLGQDSQDYQLLSILAARIIDSFQTAQTVYNNRTPQTAVGVGLDAMAQLYGIIRKPATKTSVTVVLSGTAGTVISNGVVADIDGNKYDLPATVTIGTNGTVSVAAVAEQAGPLMYAAGQVNVIVTPTAGWLSVTNPSATAAGTATETDAALRERILKSIFLPSQSILEGIEGAVLAVDGVTRARIYENDTSSTDSNGLPSHSICVVVEGGSENDIANAIYIHKTPGTGTFGNTTVPVTSIYGFSTNINYQELQYADLTVTVNITPLVGYSDAIADEIKSSIVNYISNLDIADDVAISSLLYAAMLAQPNQYAPAYSVTSLTAGLAGSSEGAADIAVGFDEAAAITADNINIVVAS